jgi:hypothetical protein
MRPDPLNAFGALLNAPFPQILSRDEVGFLSDASAAASRYGLGIVFGGPSRSDICCLFLVVPFPGYEEVEDGANLPDGCVVHGVEYTGDLVTDITCLLNSFSEMGRTDSAFGHFNTVTRWDASQIGLS